MIKVETNNHRTLTEPYVLRVKGWTEERFYREAPDNRICEFVKGELIMYSPSTAEHQKVVNFLLILVSCYCSKSKFGEALSGPAVVRILPGVNREPDIFMIPQERSHLVKGLPIRTVPDLIIEVSYTTQDIDLGEKRMDYERAGVKEYWVVDIEDEVVYVYVLRGGKYEISRHTHGRIDSTAMPGFFIRAEWLWQEPLPSVLDCLDEILLVRG